MLFVQMVPGSFQSKREEPSLDVVAEVGSVGAVERQDPVLPPLHRGPGARAARVQRLQPRLSCDRWTFGRTDGAECKPAIHTHTDWPPTPVHVSNAKISSDAPYEKDVSLPFEKVKTGSWSERLIYDVRFAKKLFLNVLEKQHLTMCNHSLSNCNLQLTLIKSYVATLC